MAGNPDIRVGITEAIPENEKATLSRRLSLEPMESLSDFAEAETREYHVDMRHTAADVEA